VERARRQLGRLRRDRAAVELDYYFEPDAFLGWLDRLERAGARVFIPPAPCAGISPAYLLELAQAGVPTVATVIWRREPRGPRGVMAARGWSRVVMNRWSRPPRTTRGS